MGSHFLLKLKCPRTVYNPATWRYDTEYKYKIVILDVHPNVVVLGHDLFRDQKEVSIIGFHQLEFKDEDKPYLSL